MRRTPLRPTGLLFATFQYIWVHLDTVGRLPNHFIVSRNRLHHNVFRHSSGAVARFEAARNSQEIELLGVQLRRMSAPYRRAMNDVHAVRTSSRSHVAGTTGTTDGVAVGDLTVGAALPLMLIREGGEPL